MKRLIAALGVFFSFGAQAEVIDVSNDEFQKLINQGVKVVDLRTAGEWQQTGVVAGSHMITLFDERGRPNPDWNREVNTITPTPQPVVLICRTGNRTGVAAKMMNEANPTRKIYNVKQGITGWMRAGLPVVPFQQNVKTAGVRCGPVC